MGRTASTCLGPQEAARQRQRDIDAAVREMLLQWPLCARSWAERGGQLVVMNILYDTRRYFARIQSTRQAARTLSNCAHSKRRDRTAATTEQLKSELARAKA